MKHVTILVTHLLGSGHLSRALTLARAARDAGYRAQVISGGMPAAHLDASGIDFLQLPPVRSDGSTFSRMLDDSGDLVGQPLLDERSRIIVEALRNAQPDVFITELFPFGRRLLRAEFGEALAAAKSLAKPPVILSSIRDIPAPPLKDRKIKETETWLVENYDGVLVHADPDVVPFESVWPVTPPVERLLIYTGFVAPPKPVLDPSSDVGTDEIIVTAGGGPTGRQLFATAVEAARLSPVHNWRLLVGGSDGVEVSAWLNGLAAGAPVIAEPVRRDYRQMLARCAAAVGQCGYNTAMDWLQAGVPGVFVPFSESGEVEQTIRAEALRDRYGYGMIAEGDVTAENLAQAAEAAVRRGRFSADGIRLDGAAQTGSILAELLEKRG